MKKFTKISFIISIIALALVIPVVLIGFIKGKALLIAFGFVYLVGGNIIFNWTYPELLKENRKSERWCKKLSDDELEIVEDAKELVKSVDDKIVLSSFNVYKVRFVKKGWFSYDEDTQELSIFIPFKYFFRKGGKNLCFLAVLHEILHSQNLKKNLRIFNQEFLEGLNQLLTNWLIEKYSEKYKLPKYFSIRLKKSLDLELIYAPYQKEVNMVRKILQKSNVDFKQVFLNYIDIQPEFFKDFVPSKYLINQ